MQKQKLFMCGKCDSSGVTENVIFQCRRLATQMLLRSLVWRTLSTTLRRTMASSAIPPPPAVLGDVTPQNFKKELMETFLKIEKLDTHLFRSHHLMKGMSTSPYVYGGQVIGQALSAASETVPSEYHPHSLHCYFIKAGLAAQPILYHVDPVRDGRSFYSRYVKAVQNGASIFTCQISFHKEEPDSISHQCVMPDVPKPEDLKDGADLLREKIESGNLSPAFQKEMQRRLNNLPTTFEIRPVDPMSYLRLRPAAPKLHLWVKANGEIGDDVRLHHCVAAYISDSSMIGTALLPHVAAGFKTGMVFSLDHSMWIHRYKFKIDEWMLYETESTAAAACRGLIFGRLWDRDGTLVMSTAQEGLIRAKLEVKETEKPPSKTSEEK